MKNNYETAEAVVIGNAHAVILGAKEPIERESDTDPFLIIMDDDE